jgi:tRNA uridine 5-carboxymethylaminomethyl modification enzyme
LSHRRRKAVDTHLQFRTTAAYATTAEGKADALYAPYVERQAREWSAVRASSDAVIPSDLDFSSIAGMSAEMAERLAAARPDNLDQASRVAGISPAALTALHLTISRRAA